VDTKIILKAILKKTVRVILPLTVKNTSVSKRKKKSKTQNRATEINHASLHVESDCSCEHCIETLGSIKGGEFVE
jgi:hypothetical protein